MMKNNHFILLVCILFGLQSPIAAQSSGRVYSPYAQYLTNDTTIPPPVGEPADAALSCFRHDTIYVLIMPTGQLYIWLRPDPLMDKHIDTSPYAYCNGNPLKYIDPEGMDSISITYNAKTNKWVIGNPVISKGNDVISVTGKDGNTTNYTFSEGEYGKRICSVRLESTVQQTLGIFYLSGAGFAGYSVEPIGEPSNDIIGRPITIGEYNIRGCEGNKWTGWPEQFSNTLAAGRGVCVHYAGKHDENFELMNLTRIAVQWTTKCMVVSNNYTLDNAGYVLYNSIESFNTAFQIAKYCGASGYTIRTTNNNKGNYYICNGINNNGIIRIIK